MTAFYILKIYTVLPGSFVVTHRPGRLRLGRE